MTNLDWTVIGVYLFGLVAFAAVQARRQRSLWDYYLAGRRVPWWQSGMSTMATQLGAISFVSAPAFVALKPNGGLKWLCYEFGVPLGILLVLIWIIPRLHRGNHISIYEYLEERFDAGTRSLVSLLFQLGRGLATAVSVLAGGLILSTALPLSTTSAILLIGVVTIVYDALGGMRVVLVSDVAQMLIIMLGIGVCGVTALKLVGWAAAVDALGPERWRILDFGRWGLTSGGEYGFWPMTIGGIFLYASYYGCDQSQVQRELSVAKLSDVKRSLLFNAFGRFPVVLFYCVMGVLVGAVFTMPEQMSHVAWRFGMDIDLLSSTLQDNPDRMVPMFILTFLPAGVVGLVFVAIMSALMSSLDSAINSLSAATMQDFYRRYARRDATERHYMIVSKLLTVFWGGFCVLAALVFANSAEAARQTTIVLINAVGSLLYGPILAAFLVGVATRLVSGGAMKIGIVLGIAVNVVLWQTTDVSWLWWNFVGFAVATVSSIGLQVLRAPEGWRSLEDMFRPGLGALEAVRGRTSVFGYTLLIIVVAYGLQQMG
ncbi:MAG: sodium/solute symporter [Candidatus Krumholzibacteriia bacterium]